MIIKKVSVEFLLECLLEIQQSGVEFVDIEGHSNVLQDSISFIIREDGDTPDVKLTINEDIIKKLLGE